MPHLLDSEAGRYFGEPQELLFFNRTCFIEDFAVHKADPSVVKALAFADLFRQSGLKP